jgi:hypothetical protein
MSYNERDPMLPHGTDKCQCPTCELYFNSTYAFDLHRRGEKGDRIENRRCLTMLEMQSSGWTQGPRGHWLSPRKGAGAESRQ